MWHNPRLLDIAAGALTGVALLLFALSIGSLALKPNLLPLREITVLGIVANTPRADLENALAADFGGSFLAVDLAAMRRALESLPWVRQAELRRVWPDRVEARLDEHVALASWGDDDMIDQQGARFAASASMVDSWLPAFDGPEGTEAELTRRYRRFNELLAPLGTELRRIELSSRYAWRIYLTSGLEILLGRDSPTDPVEGRLQRFVDAYPDTLGRIARSHSRVDLRYPNGFALRVPELAGSAPRARPPAASTPRPRAPLATTSG